MLLLVIRATPLPQVWLFVFSFPVILACSSGFHAPVCSDFMVSDSPCTRPVDFTKRTGTFILLVFGSPCTRSVGFHVQVFSPFLTSASHFTPFSDVHVPMFGVLMSASRYTRSIDFSRNVLWDVRCPIYFAPVKLVVPCKLEVC